MIDELRVVAIGLLLFTQCLASHAQGNRDIPRRGAAVLSQELLPKVAIEIEPGMLSEQVDIKYFMEGDFGGHASFVQRLPNLRKYVINASVENKPAKHALILVYAKGCQFSSFDIIFTSSSDVEERQFRCEPLEGVYVTGYIDPHELPVDKPVNVVAEFEATWICHYFNLEDCIVPSVAIGKVGSIDPANGGHFQITVPDFLSDPSINSLDQINPEHIGTIVLVVKDESLRRTLGVIEPKNSTLEQRGLQIQRGYPNLVEFTFNH